MPIGPLARKLLEFADEAGDMLRRFTDDAPTPEDVASASRRQERFRRGVNEQGEFADFSEAFQPQRLNPLVESRMSELAYSDPQAAIGIAGGMLRDARTPQEFYEALRMTRIARGPIRGQANVPSSGGALEQFRLDRLREDFPTASREELVEIARQTVRSPLPEEVQDAIDVAVIEAAQRFGIRERELEALARGVSPRALAAELGVSEDILEEATRAIDAEALRVAGLEEDVAEFGTQAMPPQSLSARDRLGVVGESDDLTAGERALREQTTMVPDARDYTNIEVQTPEGPGTIQLPMGRRFTAIEDDPRLAERLMDATTSSEMFEMSAGLVERMRSTGSEASLREVAGEIKRAVDAGELSPRATEQLRREYMREYRRLRPAPPPSGPEQTARAVTPPVTPSDPTGFTPWAGQTFGGPGGTQFRRRSNPVDPMQTVLEEWVPPSRPSDVGFWRTVPGRSDFAGSAGFTRVLPQQLTLPGTTQGGPRPPLWAQTFEDLIP